MRDVRMVESGLPLTLEQNARHDRVAAQAAVFWPRSGGRLALVERFQRIEHGIELFDVHWARGQFPHVGDAQSVRASRLVSRQIGPMSDGSGEIRDSRRNLSHR